MIAVRVNGIESGLRTEGVVRVGDLIELVKTVIDPDHMIVEIEVNGAPITDDIWGGTLQAVRDSHFDFFTNTRTFYLTEQVGKSIKAVQACYVQFRDARKTFQGGDTQGGNQKLVQATDTMKSFFDWYSVLLQLANEEQKLQMSLEPALSDILNSCKSICQLQLYKSWWALGENIQNDLEPQLDRLEDKCRTMVGQFARNNTFKNAISGT
jgi:cell fate (sporulation/competence/biofilm development) regulator YlbF (YheA/YmcA/DUF963 family)